MNINKIFCYPTQNFPRLEWLKWIPLSSMEDDVQFSTEGSDNKVVESKNRYCNCVNTPHQVKIRSSGETLYMYIHKVHGALTWIKHTQNQPQMFMFIKCKGSSLTYNTKWHYARAFFKLCAEVFICCLGNKINRKWRCPSRVDLFLFPRGTMARR